MPGLAFHPCSLTLASQWTLSRAARPSGQPSALRSSERSSGCSVGTTRTGIRILSSHSARTASPKQSEAHGCPPPLPQAASYWVELPGATAEGPCSVRKCLSNTAVCKQLSGVCHKGRQGPCSPRVHTHRRFWKEEHCGQG